MKALVSVKLKPAILDPQGKAVLHSLQQLGFDEVKSVRIGKLVELEIETGNEDSVQVRVDELSKKLLINPLMETFDIKLVDEKRES
ncbi:MAG: phosphoribosylformylglycinamidine synthase subunit PurS [Calditrichaeota bacterium]|nr:phosphoribosylformylglycinamidine synthase subunit PurS [Calditrichota bacterium]